MLPHTHFEVAAGVTAVASVHRYRSVVLTHYRLARAAWKWSGRAYSPNPVASFAFPLNGPATLEAEGRVRLAAPSVLILHTEREAAVDWHGNLQCVMATVPMEALQELGITPEALPWAGDDDVLVRAARGFLLAAVQQARDDSSLAAYLMEKLVVEMMFGIALEQSNAPVAGQAEVSVIERARSLMVVRRADPGFNPQELADELHVSLRHLQREFARYGSAPAAELRRLRVELAQAILANPEYAPLSIPDIARYAGFGSTAAMRRAFAEGRLPSPMGHRPALRSLDSRQAARNSRPVATAASGQR